MRDTSVNVRVQYSVYMTNDSYLKFQQEPFKLVYRNETLNQNQVVTHWAEVYQVNWTFIDQYLIVKE
jgi:DNA/RNA-binding domain of Phe-tRNA-synthetase-like protein